MMNTLYLSSYLEIHIIMRPFLLFPFPSLSLPLSFSFLSLPSTAPFFSFFNGQCQGMNRGFLFIVLSAYFLLASMDGLVCVAMGW